MSRTAWKARERDAAAIFGTRRATCNSSGRPDFDGSDSTHERLHIEVKSYKRHAAWTLWCAAREVAHKACAKAKAFGRKPIVLALAQDHKAGLLLCVHEDEMAAVIVEWLVAQEEPVVSRITQAVSQRRWAMREGEPAE